MLLKISLAKNFLRTFEVVCQLSAQSVNEQLCLRKVTTAKYSNVVLSIYGII